LQKFFVQVDKKELPGRTLLPVPGYEEKVEFGVLVSFAYRIKGEESEVVVSTTRVETMLGDTAVAVHPEDPRYQHLIGKLPIVPDSFVDREFGTGAVKITPAHDHNDYEVGQRHNLPFITCIDDDGNISPGCGEFSGMRRFDARKAVIEALKKRGLYRGSEDNAMVVPVCSRSKDIIEPLLKAQWYVKCDEMARKAVAAVESGELKLIPDYHVATWNRWLQSNRDWCISRQLWWGHRIPAYFVTVTDGKTPAGDPCDDRYWVSAHSEEIAIQKAAKKFNVDPKFIKLKWDEDVLDTWFSSGMWPFAIMGWPEKTSDMQLYFPSNVLETGHDILFFWVARMVFMSQELTGKLPFKEVYLHAMIRDAHGRKMSKSLGNVIDPLDVIRGVTLAELNRQLTSGNLDAKELAIAQAGQARDYPKGIPECGTDALRFALLAYTSQGRDINLDVLRVQGYRFFCNKIWQAVRFTLMQLGTDYKAEPFKISGKESIMDKWILSRMACAVGRCNGEMDTYNFTQFTTTLYEFWLYDLCDIYLEAVKPVIASGSDEARKVAKATLYHCVETGLRLISPVMPFLSEELWQHLPRLATHPPSIIVHAYPETSEYPFANEKIEADVSFAMSVIRTIRSLRSDYELTNKTKTDLYASVSSEEDHRCLTSLIPLIETLASSNKVEILLQSKINPESIPSGCAHVTISSRCTAYIALQGIINVERELVKLAGKKEKNEAQVAKLLEQQNRPDYEEKVPLPVRIANAEKKEALLIEMKSIEAAMAALSG
ncbi:valine--tRNA ligase, partial [Ancylostoma caninum]